MSCTDFPSSGLIPNVTTHTVGNITYIWTGIAWESQVNVPAGELVNDLSQAYIFETVADYQASTIVFPVGKTIHLNDRDADFTVITGTGTANGYNVIASNSTGQSVDLIVKNNNYISSQYGATNTASINLIISNAPEGATVTISAGTNYDRDTILINENITVVHQDDISIEQANVKFGAVPGGGAGHISFYGRAGSGAWCIPKLGSANVAPQTASCKVFHDDFIHERLTYPSNSSYRVGIFTSDLDGSSAMGTGSIRMDGKGGGEYAGTNPDVLITQHDGDFIHARAVTLPAQPANTTMNGYDLYQFDEINQIWAEGVAVITGQLIMTYGRVLEAQNTGITGANRPRHGTYAQQVLTVSNGSLYQIGEFVIDTVNPPLRQAKIQNIIGNDIYLQSGTEETWVSGWLVGNTLRGLTTLTEQVISVNQLINKDFTGTGERDYPLENEFSFTGRPVSGLIQSDGVINWKFIDDLKEFVPSNGPNKQVIMLGDVKGKQPIQGMGNTVELANGATLIGLDGLLMYCPTNGNTFKVARNSSCEFEITNPSGTNSVAMSDTGRFLALRNTAIQLSGTTINDNSAPSVKGINILNMGSSGNAAIDLTAFSFGIPFQEVILRATTNGITIKEGAGFALTGGVDVLLTSGNVIKFVSFDGSKFTQIGGNI